MPTNPPGYMQKYFAKNGAKNYKKYQGTPKAIKERATRNGARAKMVDLGHAKKGDGKDVHHVNGVKNGNSIKNLRVVSQKANRGKLNPRSGHKYKK